MGLTDAGSRPVEEYSRGMKQRLHLARGLLSDPEVLFLDEPTMGLDPSGAQELRALIPELAKSGKTILLTTHYMSEADLLCDQVVIIDKGSVVAAGTPSDIKRTFSRVAALDIRVNPGRADDVDQLTGVTGVERVSYRAPRTARSLTTSCIQSRASSCGVQSRRFLKDGWKQSLNEIPPSKRPILASLARQSWIPVFAGMRGDAQGRERRRRYGALALE